MEERVLPERLLPLKGVFNFRDMGGLKTRDGRRVKKGLIFRAAELTGLTAGDIDYLKELKIRYIYDYRDREEAALKPDPRIGYEKHERVAVNGEDRSTAHSEWDPETFYKTFTREKFVQVYAQMPIQNASYQRMMSLVARPEHNLPFVHHCTGGRDRTGVGAMLILKTLGVPTDTVIDDYMFSNQTLSAFHEEMFEEASQYISGAALKCFEDGFLLHEEFLEASMQSISETYGTFEHYLNAEFGITEHVREKIQNFCLE